MKPYKLASKELHKEPSVIEIGHGITVGGKQLAVFAGPCAIESQEQFTTVSKAVKASGANILRGGAFKPRSSPYSFQGLEGDGLNLLQSMPILCKSVQEICRTSNFFAKSVSATSLYF